MRLRLIRLETTIPHGNSTSDQQSSNKALITALILFVKVVKKHDIYRKSWLPPPTVIQQSPLSELKQCWVRLGTGLLCNCKAKSDLYTSPYVVKIMNKFLIQQLMGSRDPFVPPLLSYTSIIIYYQQNSYICIAMSC